MTKLKEKFYYLIGQQNKNKIKQIRVKINSNLVSILRMNEQFRDIHKGKRCFILGSGPSVKNVDFSKLANEYTFTVNHFARFEKFEELKTNYHVFGDERIFYSSGNSTINQESLDYLEKLNNSSKSIQYFIVYSAKRFFEDTRILTLSNINYFYNVLDFYKDYKEAFDITKAIPWFPTCIDYCIAIAIFMGFSEIYLLGCECTGFSKLLTSNSSQGSMQTYGYKLSDNERNRLKEQIKTYGAAEELQLWADIMKDYNFLETYSQKHNIKIINCTDGGILESFERKTLDEVLK